MDESVKHRDLPLVTHYQTPEVGDPGNGAFDFPASFVASQLSSILPVRFFAILPVRADQINSSFCQTSPQGVGISGFVVNQPRWVFSRTTAPFPWHCHLF